MTETATQTTITTLASRGIEKVARAAGWEDRANHWRYPVYGLFGKMDTEPLYYRCKAFDSAQKPKYWFDGAKSDAAGADYYCPRDLAERIKRAHGELFIAAGEIDLLTLIAAGQDNVLSWFGEGNIPSSITGYLRGFKVSKVIYIPDLDGPGLNAAAKLDAIMRDSGIPVTYWALTGGEWGTGWDLNNEWQDCIYDPKAFDARMDNICATFAHYCAWYKRPMPTVGTDPKAADSPQPSTPAPQLPQSQNDNPDWRALNDEWWQNVVMPLLPKPGRDGKAHCPNPAHDDKHPSFRISTDKIPTGMPVCSCNVQDMDHPRDVVARWVNATPFMDWFKENRKPATNGTDKTQLHITPATAPTQPLPVPVEGHAIESQIEASENVRRSIQTGRGAVVYPFPLREFRLNGGAPFCVSGKMTGIAGASGTGKTTFFATLIDALLAQGVVVYLNSPEWSKEELYIRDIQAVSGGRLTYHRIHAHINALQSEEMGIPIPDDLPGKFTGADLALFDVAADTLSKRNLEKGRGRVYYVDTSLPLEKQLAEVGAAIAHDRANGILRHAYVDDYLQAHTTEIEPKRGKNDEQAKLFQIKRWSDPKRANVHTFLATQVTKEQSSKMRESGKRLGAEAIHSINQHDFNYLIALNLVYQRHADGTLVMDNGTAKPEVVKVGSIEAPAEFPLLVAAILKNNSGPSGGLIPICNNWQSGRMEAIDISSDGLPLAGSRRGL